MLPLMCLFGMRVSLTSQPDPEVSGRMVTMRMVHGPITLRFPMLTAAGLHPQNDPEVEEVEVNVDGQWRPEGREGRWRDITETPGAAAAAEHAAAAAQARCVMQQQRVAPG